MDKVYESRRSCGTAATATNQGLSHHGMSATNPRHSYALALGWGLTGGELEGYPYSEGVCVCTHLITIMMMGTGHQHASINQLTEGLIMEE